MTFPRITASLWLTAILFALPAGAAESNFWPARVAEKGPDGQVESWTSLGPLLFSETSPAPESGRVAGFRPFFVHWTTPAGDTRETDVLYPLFFYRTYRESFQWSFFDLINRYGRRDGGPAAADGADDHSFDIWPIYFSKETGNPATSYHSVMPIIGRIHGLLGYETISWVLFPLYAQTEKRGARTTYAPWPFIRVTRGAETGAAVWPLFGHADRPGVYNRTYWLWPLFWNNTVWPGPDAPPDKAPLRQIGAMPFYSSDRGPDVTNVNYLIFFGTTDRTAPVRYHETRYFWPFFLQGEGDDRMTDRWAPFYTHSVIKGLDKTWTLWPLFKRTHWADGNIAQDKTQLFYFFYWHLEQHKLSDPEAAPAEKTYLWPLFSSWDNGAGRRQVEILSPFEGVFADNPRVRQGWTPFFALWRYDQRAPGEVRASLLWNAVTWKRSDALGRSEFHLGPLFSVMRGPAGRRYTLGGGLVGFESGPNRDWRLFCMEFQPRRTMLSSIFR